MPSAKVHITDRRGNFPRQFSFDLQACLGAFAVFDIRVDARNAGFDRQRRRSRVQYIRKNGSAGGSWRKYRDVIIYAVALERVRRSTRRNSVVIKAEASADDGFVIRRIGKTDARREIVSVGADRIRQELQIISGTEI